MAQKSGGVKASPVEVKGRGGVWISKVKRGGKTKTVVRTSERGEDGKWIVSQTTLTGTASEIKARAEEITGNRHRNLWGSGCGINMTLQAFEEELPSLFTKCAVSTWDSAWNSWERFKNAIKLPKRLADITPDHVRAFEYALRNEKTRSGRLLSPVAIRKILMALRSVLGRAVKSGYLRDNAVSCSYTLPSEKECKTPIIDMTFQQIGSILAAVNADNDVESRVFFWLLVTTGMRISECALIEWQNYDADTGRLLLTTTKTSVDRVTFVSPATSKALNAWRKKQGLPIRGYVFPVRNVKTARDRWSRKMKALCSADKNLSFVRKYADGTTGVETFTAKHFRTSFLNRGEDLGGEFRIGDRLGLGHGAVGVGHKHYQKPSEIQLEKLRTWIDALDANYAEAVSDVTNRDQRGKKGNLADGPKQMERKAG